jgi:hypothetical protein
MATLSHRYGTVVCATAIVDSTGPMIITNSCLIFMDRPWFIGKKSPRRFFQTAVSLPPAKGVTFAGYLVPALLKMSTGHS